MRTAIVPSDELLKLAAGQAGVITRMQAAQLGVGRHSQQRLVANGNWSRIGPGLLLTTNAAPDWDALAWAGVIQAGSGARLGGLAAAYKHRLIDKAPKVIDILHPHGTCKKNHHPWRFHQERRRARQSRVIGSPPRTLIEDTVLDLAGTKLGAYDHHDALHWLTTAVQRRLTTADRLLHALDGRRYITGRSELVELLTEVEEGVETPLEHYYAVDVERAHGLPTGTRQVHAMSGNGSIWRDVRYDKYRLLVELDGQTGHTGVDRFRDYRRDNAALVAGDDTLRYGWWDVRHAMCGCAHQVAGLLAKGGWEGIPTRCPRCPLGLFETWP